MTIVLAEHAGFCFGVQRALDLTLKAGIGGNTYTLGELIHNPFVVGDLDQRGIRSVDSLDNLPENASVVIRSHGVSRSIYEEMEKRNIDFTDATCPFVKKIHCAVSSLSSDTIVIISGKAEHPELVGIVGHCIGPSFVIRSLEEAMDLLSSHPTLRACSVALISQTTFSLNEWSKIKKFILKECTKVQVFDTICKATVERQEAARKLAQKADCMVVIGGKNSSNTLELFSLCQEHCPTVLVEDVKGLERCKETLSGCTFIGVTAGASTPACIIKEVLNSMSVLENNTEELNFGELLDQYSNSIHNGDKIKAIVTQIKPTEVIVDAGTKHTCYVPLEQLTRDPNAKAEDVVKVGDEIELVVVRVNDVEGTAMMSKVRLDDAAGFEKVMTAGETGETLTGIVTEVIKGGVLVLTNGVKVFIPASQTGVPRDGDLNTLLRQEVTFKVLETNRQRRRAVGSISVLARAARKEAAKKIWDTIESGQTYTGKVKSLTNYGAFVDLGGVDGRISLTDLTWLRVKSPADVVSIGESIEVTVKDVDRENNRISLVYKKTEDNPWEKIKSMYQVGDVVNVKIMSVTNFGAFAQIIPGIDGLIHISQIARERVEKVADKLSVGQVVEAKITELDYENKRASLSIKALLPEPEVTEEAPAEEE